MEVRYKSEEAGGKVVLNNGEVAIIRGSVRAVL